MPLSVFTSRVIYSGSDRLDVTIKSALPEDKIFAPTWELLRPLQTARKAWEGGNVSSITLKQAYDTAWEDYKAAYIELLRGRYRQNSSRFEAVLAQNRVVFCCYCSKITPNPPNNRCHRIVLANIFVKLGAIYHGEVL